MVNLASLFGGAGYYTPSAGLTMGIGWPRVLVLNPTSDLQTIVLPDETKFLYEEARQYYFVNASGFNIWLAYANSITSGYASITAAAADQSFSAGGGLDLMPPNGYVDVSGFVNGANNGIFQVIQRQCNGQKVFLALTSGIVNETVAGGIGPATVFVARSKAFKIPPFRVAKVSLAFNPTRNRREWLCYQTGFNAAKPITSIPAALGVVRASVCAVPALPSPAPPPPPYTGVPCDLSSCPASLGVTLAGGTGVGAFWNGAARLTLIAGSPAYYRYIVDASHWIDLRCYPGGGGTGFQWQVLLVDQSGGLRKRFGNATAGTCPPLASFVCIPDPADPADCTTGGAITCTISA